LQKADPWHACNIASAASVHDVRNVQLAVSGNAAGAGGDYDGGAKFKDVTMTRTRGKA
jgi:hypothetical protein